MARPCLRWFTLLVCFTFFLPSADAVYRIGKRKTPDDVLTKQERPERLAALRKGELFSEGGYSARGVWAKMEAFIDAPPALVWQLYIATNDWKGYGIPFLFDSRAVTEPMVEAAQSMKKADEIFAMLGEQVINPTQNRKKGGRWTSYAFQHVNVKWPLEDRWLIIMNRHDETRGNEGVYQVEWSLRAGDIKLNEGMMILEPFDGNAQQTLMIYQVDIHPGAWVPRFLMKGVIQKSMPDAIYAIRRAAARAQGRAGL